MAADTDDFHVWLCERLKSLNLDEEVLGEYIAGILDSDDSNEEEKVEVLADILGGMMDSPVIDVCSGIFVKWKESEAEKLRKKKEEESKKQDALVAVMEKQSKVTKVENLKPASQRVDVDVKKHVIQYQQQSDDEDIKSDSEEEYCQTDKPRPLEKNKGVFQNTNSLSVVEKEKEKREKQKLENDEKKLKAKQDREKQKEKVDLRKDKEKKRTQKGERRTR